MYRFVASLFYFIIIIILGLGFWKHDSRGDGHVLEKRAVEEDWSEKDTWIRILELG